MTDATATPGLSIEVEADSSVHFALQQNDVPLVKLLRVRNAGADELCDLRVTVTLGDALAAPWQRRIDRLPPGATHNFETVDLRLDGDRLRARTERERTLLRTRVAVADVEVAVDERPVEVLAFDEWPGLAALPALLASFVLPNHPAVDGLLARTGTRLRQATGDGALDGYQARDPARVRAIVRATFDALGDCDLGYAAPPASFEQDGQRVRLPDRILETRLGTCLDLALLHAALLEQAGVRPLLVLTRGHAFVGAWQVDESFQDVAGDDGLRLRKRIDVGDVVAVETTMLTADAARDFERAVDAGRRHLEDLDAFRAVIDVAAARKARFLPLPVRCGGDGARLPGAATPETAGAALPDDAPPAPASAVSPFVATPVPETPASRLDRWKRRLLDLGFRNRLIAFRETRQTIRLASADLAAVEDALAAGREFVVTPRPAVPAGARDRDAELHRARTGEDLTAALLAEELAAGRLVADLPADELDRRLLEVFRHTRTALEESGANPLHLALGMLRFYESPSSSVPRAAPILLLPLTVERPTALSGVRVRLADDEPRVNVTLLEKLATEFPVDVRGLDEIVEDERGVDVAEVLRRFRRAVLNVERWEVLDEAWIAPFSFTKFLMWRDLQERAPRLLESPVLRHLVERPGASFEPDAEFPEPDELDRDLPVDRTFCPLDADSSQLAAVRAAQLGRSFVLEGPPGTGKSQTITNLIAQCIADGRRVLFVSEKMAALDVVRRRLESVGLAPFCLELHSNRTSKRAVVEQLLRTLDGARVREPAAWRERAERLEHARAELNRYVRTIHEARAFGESVYQVTSRLCGMRDVPRVALDVGPPGAVDSAWVGARRDAVDRLATAASAIGHPDGHPLRALRRADWEATLSDRFDAACGSGRAALDGLDTAARRAGAMLGADVAALPRAPFASLCDAVRLVLDTPGTAARALTEPGWADLRPRLLGHVEEVRQKDALREHVRVALRDRALELDLEQLRADLGRAIGSFWPLSWWRARAVRARLAPVAATAGVLPSDAELVVVLERAVELRARIRALADPDHEAAVTFGRQLWSGGDPGGAAGVARLVDALDWAGRLRTVLGRLREAGLAAAATRLVALATDERDALADGAAAGDALRALDRADAAFRDARDAFDDLLAVDDELAFGAAGDPAPWLATCRATIDTWQAAQRASLDDWCHWRHVRGGALGLGLGPIVDAFESDALPAAGLPEVFERAFREAWLAAVTDAEEVLRTFHGREHERRIRRFAELDEALIRVGREVVAARLWQQVPQRSERASDSSEVGTVLREARKKRGHLAVRKLFRSIPNLLPRLKPCMLMSPLSVAQYLTDELPPFDVVVFDEASQITPWDAVGAIARGRACVVVGDTRQLPPTSFFQRADGDDGLGEELDYEELESVLDECAAAGLRPLRLRWHYRSRHESLIAFSNHHYYDNRLLTFPGPEAVTDRLGVSLVAVPDGVYDRAKSRTNRLEAESVVADVVGRLSGGDPGDGAPTIGVVTFSQAQQLLIEDLLDDARRRHPEIERHFHGDEAVFVKNLENVQGDERDVILFSVGYGPDAAGKVSMNFGPLNVAGGERRLNVAITRARRQVVVHATLRPEQIDLTRSNALGVKHLKTFLDYAARGPVAIAEASALDGDAAFESPFEREVCAALRARGHDVAVQVGCSGYRIDLAVRDPDAPGRFALGVECDGAFYHAAKTARDRDRLREAVLRRLGWSLCRIWSTDWWRSPEREVERVERALRDALRARTVEVPGVGAGAASTVAPAADPARGAAAEASEACVHPEASAPAAGDTVPSGPAAPDPDAGREPGSAPVPTPGPALETPYTVRPSEVLGSSDDFHLPSSTAALRGLVLDVLDCEAPVHRELLCRRVAAAWQARATPRVRERILAVVAELPPDRRPVERGGFLWPPSLDPAGWRGYRVPVEGDPATARVATEIPTEECANAVAAVLREQIAMPRTDLVREAARRLGFARTGSRVEEAFAAGIELALARGDARADADRIALG